MLSLSNSGKLQKLDLKGFDKRWKGFDKRWKDLICLYNLDMPQEEKSTATCIPRRSPIQVLTGLNLA